MSGTRIRNSDLQLARKIHFSLLPTPFEDERVEFAFTYDPMEGVGGDYCHVGYVDSGRLAINVSDVTGHGIPAALLVGRVNSFVRGFLQTQEDPRELVESLNSFLCAHFSGIGLFMTFYAGLLDPVKRRFAFAGAGHPPAIIVPPRAKPYFLGSQNPILGVSPMDVCADTRDLEKGSLIIFFTDGIIEARNGRHSLYGIDRLVQFVEKLRGSRAADVVQEVRRDALRHCHGQPNDDCLILTLRLK